MEGFVPHTDELAQKYRASGLWLDRHKTGILDQLISLGLERPSSQMTTDILPTRSLAN